MELVIIIITLLIVVLVISAFRGKDSNNRSKESQAIFEYEVERLVRYKMDKHGMSRDEATRIVLGE